MKTLKGTFRGAVASFVLAFALAFGLLPAEGIAYAADAIAAAQVYAEAPLDEGTAASQDEPEAALDGAGPTADPSGEAADAGDASALAEGAAPREAEAQEPMRPHYTNASEGHTAALLPLQSEAEPAAGIIECGGLAYRIDPQAPDSASVTGIATEKPKGEVRVQPSVASDGKLYQVKSIRIGAESDGSDAAEDAVEEAQRDGDVYGKDRFQPDALAPDATSLFIPASIEQIDPAFFQLLPGLQTIVVDEASTAFAGINGMLFDADVAALVAVPEGLQGTALLPASLSGVPRFAFSRCGRLSSIALAGEGTADHLAVRNGILYSADLSLLIAAPAGLGATATIAQQCAEIAEGAFWGNHSLKTIVTGARTTAIGPDAFSATTPGEATVLIEASGDAYGDARACWETAGFTRFADPPEPGQAIEPVEGSGFAFTLLDDRTLEVRWQGDGAAPERLVVPDYGVIDGVRYQVSAVAAGGFAHQADVQQVELPDGLTSIGAAAFEGLRRLHTVRIPGSVTSIGARAFADCESLVALELDEGLRAIGDAAFQGIAQRAIVLPTSVTAIGAAAFADCPALGMIVALGTVQEVGADVLAGMQGVSVYVPYLPDGAYAWTAGLPAAGNHVLPYGVKLAGTQLSVDVGERADLFAEGYLEAPGDFKVSYTYKAKPISISDDGIVEGKEAGSSNVEVTLELPVPTQAATGITAKAARLVPAAYGADGPSEGSGPGFVEFDRPIVLRATAAVMTADAGVMPMSADVASGVVVLKCADTLSGSIKVQGYRATTSYSSRTITIRGITSLGNLSQVYGSVDGYAKPDTSPYLQITLPTGNKGLSLDGSTLLSSGQTIDCSKGAKVVYVIGAPAPSARIVIKSPASNVKYSCSSGAGTIQSAKPLVITSSSSASYSYRVNSTNTLSIYGTSNLYGTAQTYTITGAANTVWTYEGSHKKLEARDYYLTTGNATVTLVPSYASCAPSASNTATTSSNALTIKNAGTTTFSWTRSKLTTDGNSTAEDNSGATSGTVAANSSLRVLFVTEFSVAANGTITLIGKNSTYATCAYSRYTITPSSAVKYWQFTAGNIKGMAEGAYLCDTSGITLTAQTRDLAHTDSMHSVVFASSNGAKVRATASGGLSYTTTDSASYRFWFTKLETHADGTITFFGAYNDTQNTQYLWTVDSPTAGLIGFGTGNTYATATRANMLPTGHIFDGPALASLIPSNRTLYPQFGQTTITLNANKPSDGLLHSAGTTSTTAYYGQYLSTVALPSIGGFTSLGYWDSTTFTGTQFTDSVGTGIAAWNCTLPAYTLYSRNGRNYASIIFDPNTGTGTRWSGTYYFNGALPATSNNGSTTIAAFTKTGYTFAGWSTSSGLSNASGKTTLAPIDSSRGAAYNQGSITVYAIWEKMTYTITFNGNGGLGGNMPASVTYKHGEALPSLAAYTPPAIENATFTGWWDTSWPTGGTQYYNAAGEYVKYWEGGPTLALYARFDFKTSTLDIELGAADRVIQASTASDFSSGVTESKHALLVSDTKYIVVMSATTVRVWRSGVMRYYRWKPGQTPDCVGWTGPDGKTLAVGRCYAMTGQQYWTIRPILSPATVTLNNQSATTAGSTSVAATYGKAMTAITPPAKTGHTFNGYYSATNGGGTKYYNANGSSAHAWDMGISGVGTLYASWTANTYTITFDTTTNPTAGTGNAVTAGVYGATKVTYGAPMATPAGYKPPSAYGNFFLGWFDSAGKQYYNADGTAYKDQVMDKAANTVLYAKWRGTSYTVKYHANGGTGEMEDSDMEFGTLCYLRKNTFTREGYTFLGWHVRADEAEAHFSDEQGCGGLSATEGGVVNLYAIWRGNAYTVTFDTTTNLPVMESYNKVQAGTYGATTVICGQPMVTPEDYAPPSANCNVFLGWFDSSGKQYYNSDGTAYSGQVMDKTADMILYAKWRGVNYTVRYNANDGEGAQMDDTPMQYGVGTKLAKNTYTRDGYTFLGWHVNAASQTVQYPDEQMMYYAGPSEGYVVNLYAIWSLQVNVTAPMEARLHTVVDGGTGQLLCKAAQADEGYFESNTVVDLYVAEMSSALDGAGGYESVFLNGVDGVVLTFGDTSGFEGSVSLDGGTQAFTDATARCIIPARSRHAITVGLDAPPSLVVSTVETTQPIRIAKLVFTYAAG